MTGQTPYQDLIALKDKLLADNPIFEGHGYVVEKFNDDGFHGFTDKIPAYFYIDLEGNEKDPKMNRNSDEIEIEPLSATVLKVMLRCVLVAVLPKGANTVVAFQSLAAQLWRFQAQPDTASLDAQYIHEDETGRKLPSSFNVVKIHFGIFSHVGTGFSKCSQELLCN